MKNFFNRENMIARIITFIVACAMWMYVMNEQNPLIERNYIVDLQQRNVPIGMLVLNLPEKVKIKVQGQRALLGDVTEDGVTAYVDFSNKNVGQQTLPVQVQFAQGDVLEIYPNNVYAYLDTASEKVVEVETRVVGIPASNYTLSKREVIPKEVVVSGAKHRVDKLTKVVAPIDINDRENDFQVETQMVAIDQDGTEMSDLKIVPNMAQVKATLVRQMITVEMPIFVATSGSLPNDLKIKKVECSPNTVKLTAEPSVLQGLSEIRTSAIDLSNVTSSTTQEVTLILPPKILAENNSVKVEIVVE